MGAEPRWVTVAEIVAAHAEQIALFGGLRGIRDENLIQSAVAKPRNRFLYEQEEDVIILAAELAIAIARNHGFIDGNKRTAFVALVLFLRLNGYGLAAPDDLSLGRMLEAVITRTVTPEAFVDRLAIYVRPG